MTTNSTRSQRQSLLEGATDGKYRKVRPNTEVVPQAGHEQTVQNRGDLHAEMNYDFITQEKPLNARAIPGT